MVRKVVLGVGGKQAGGGHGQMDKELGKGREKFSLASRRQRTRKSSPMLERAEDRSMMVLLPGLLSTERLASERSAVTRVMEILEQTVRKVTKAGPSLPSPLLPLERRLSRRKELFSS